MAPRLRSSTATKGRRASTGVRRASTGVRRASKAVGGRRASTGGGRSFTATGGGRSATAVIYMRFPTFSAIATESRTTNPNTFEVVDNEYVKIYTVPDTGVLIAFSGDTGTWEHLVDSLEGRSFASRNPPYLNDVVNECLGTINSRMKHLTSKEDTMEKKLEVAYAASIDLIITEANIGDKYISIDKLSPEGAHVPKDIEGSPVFMGSGEDRLKAFWERKKADEHLYMANDEEDVVTHMERVAKLMSNGVIQISKGSSSCGGLVSVKTTDATRKVRPWEYIQSDDSYMYSLSPYYGRRLWDDDHQ